MSKEIVELIEKKVQQLKIDLQREIDGQKYFRDTASMEQLHLHRLEAKKLRVQIETLIELQIELGEQA
jgi:CHAD domain-containing protein